MTLITISSDFVADAMRAYVDRDPRECIGCKVINDLAAALQDSAASDHAQHTNATTPIQQQGAKTHGLDQHRSLEGSENQTGHR